VEGLGFNPATLLAQVINFGILFGLLYLFAYKPIMSKLDERSRKIKDSMEQTELIKQQAKHAEEEVKKQLEAAGKEGMEMMARAMHTGEEMRQKAQQEARQDAETIITRARAEIQQERDGAIDELRKEFVDLTIMAAGKVIEKSLDKQTHHQLIDKVLEESASLKKG